jgi:hypothetical protein
LALSLTARLAFLFREIFAGADGNNSGAAQFSIAKQISDEWR